MLHAENGCPGIQFEASKECKVEYTIVDSTGEPSTHHNEEVGGVVPYHGACYARIVRQGLGV